MKIKILLFSFVLIFLWLLPQLGMAEDFDADKPLVKIFSSKDLSITEDFFAYMEEFNGGVNIALGDVDGDDEIEIITVSISVGGPHLRIFDQQGNVEYQFMAFDPDYRDGVNLAVGDLDGNGIDEIIVTPRANSQTRIKVYELENGQEVLQDSYLAYAENVVGGLNLAVGDIDGNGIDELVTVPLSGGGPHIRAFRQGGQATTLNIFAFHSDYRGGVNIAVGDINNDGRAEIIVAPYQDAQARIKIYGTKEGTILKEFLAYAESFEGGAKVSVGDFNLDGNNDIITSPSQDGGPHVLAWNYQDLEFVGNFLAYDPDCRNGLTALVADINNDQITEIVTAPGPKPRPKITGPKIALTFDDGYSSSNGSFNKILSILERREIKATFFLIGKWAESHPTELKRIDNNPNLLVANHSYTHAIFTRIPESQMRYELTHSEEIFESILGHGAKPNFRYPGGGHSTATDQVIAEMGFRHFLWNASSADTKYRAATAENIASVKSGASANLFDGSIILNHLSSDALAAALDDIITYIENQGYTFVTVDELTE